MELAVLRAFAKYDWNKAVTEETPVKLVKKIPSWKKALQ